MSLLNNSVLQQPQSVEQRHSYYSFQIRAKKLILLKENICTFSKKKMALESINNLQKVGKVSTIKKGSINKIEKFLTNWIKALHYEAQIAYLHNFKPIHLPVFITLTLCSQQIHPDTVVKREILMPFIQELKRKYGIKYYFWRAELQKNYNIHFHLVTDKYIDKSHLQLCWNKHLNNLKYVDRFEAKFRHNNPPSTHIEKIDSLKKMTAYITKYVTKEENNHWIDGQKWNASKELKELKSVSFILENEIVEHINKLIDERKLEVYSDTYFAVMFFTDKFNYMSDYKAFKDIEKSSYEKLYDVMYRDRKEIKENLPSVGLLQTLPTFKHKQLLLFDIDPIKPNIDFYL